MRNLSSFTVLLTQSVVYYITSIAIYIDCFFSNSILESFPTSEITERTPFVYASLSYNRIIYNLNSNSSLTDLNYYHLKIHPDEIYSFSNQIPSTKLSFL